MRIFVYTYIYISCISHMCIVGNKNKTNKGIVVNMCTFKVWAVFVIGIAEYNHINSHMDKREYLTSFNVHPHMNEIHSYIHIVWESRRIMADEMRWRRDACQPDKHKQAHASRINSKFSHAKIQIHLLTCYVGWVGFGVHACDCTAALFITANLIVDCEHNT